jgi:hypothetical protein
MVRVETAAINFFPFYTSYSILLKDVKGRNRSTHGVYKKDTQLGRTRRTQI